MARRKQSVIDDVFEISSMLPWWVGASLAVVAYLFFHHIATQEIVASMEPGQIGKVAGRQFFKAIAMFAQYVLPIVLLGGALSSVLMRRKRGNLIATTQAQTRQSALLNMSWREFEMLVGEAFRRRGYAVVETGGNGSDGGIDLVLKKGSEIHLVQCKQWKAYKVGVDVVRALYGVMAARGAAGGFVVTSGQFTSDAKEFAAGRNVELIEGKQLLAMIKSVQSAGAIPTAIKHVDEAPSVPVCPRCGSQMVRRTAGRGKDKGKVFWGCPTFPKCRETIDITVD
jgi:restriction system protein